MDDKEILKRFDEMETRHKKQRAEDKKKIEGLKEAVEKAGNYQETTMDRYIKRQGQYQKPQIKHPRDMKNVPATICTFCNVDGVVDGVCQNEECKQVVYKINICPYCISNGKKDSICDLTKMTKWACRDCGKHWFNWALGHPYTLYLEQGERKKFEEEEKRQHELSIAGKGIPV